VSAATVHLLARELMFVARIQAEARAAGVELSLCRDPAMLPEAPGLLIVDLDLTGAIAAAAAWQRAGPERTTLGFYAHVNAELAAAAKAAGIARVMAKSTFFDTLPQLLRATAATN
jgi:hypothetical protein